MGRKFINNFGMQNDIVLLATSPAKLQELVRHVESAAKELKHENECNEDQNNYKH